MTKCVRTRSPSRSIGSMMSVEGDDLGLDADFFLEFARERLLKRLAELDHAAGQRETADHRRPARRATRTLPLRKTAAETARIGRAG